MSVDVAPADCNAFALQLPAQLSRAHEGIFLMQLVDAAHQRQIGRAGAMDAATGGRVPPPGELSRLGYQPALDGIRAVAALAVVGFHLRLAGFAGGGLGVDIFFVLSGFLITSILYAEVASRGRIAFGHFYARRALRLFPAYFAVVIVAVALYAVVVPVGGTRRGVIASFFYVANWVAASGGGLAK